MDIEYRADQVINKLRDWLVFDDEGNYNDERLAMARIEAAQKAIKALVATHY